MEHYKTVKDLDPDWTVVHVAAWARNIDNSISYTVNLKNDASVRDVERLMILAWEQGCNGITVYRDGSRTKQVLSALPKQEAAPIKKKRPHSLAGETLKYEANISGEKTNVYVTVNYVDGKPWEVFTHTPQVQSMPELQLITAATRLSSLLLRSGVSPGEIVKQLRRVEGQSLFSIPAIISNALTETSKDISAPCPDCGTNMTFSGGCSNCPECGFSTCQ